MMKRATNKSAILWAALLATALMASPVDAGLFKQNKKTPTSGVREPVLNFESKPVAAAEIADLAIVLPPPEVNADWAQPGGNATNSMGQLALPDTLTKAWSVSIGKGSDKTRRLNAPPMVYQGNVFTIDTIGDVHIFDAATGHLTWHERIFVKGVGNEAAFGGGVSANDGRIFAVTGYGLVAAFDAQSHKELWRVDLDTPLRGAPRISGGKLFTLSADNQIFALNVNNGETLWSVAGTTEPAGMIGVATPAIALDTAVVGFSSGELNALRVENGRSVWTDVLARTGRTTAISALTDIDASPVIDRGRVFAIGHGGRMVAIELATGQRVWERNFAGVSTPWVAGDFVFVVTVDAQLICLTRGEGKVRWVTQLPHYKDEKKKTDAYAWHGPVLASDRLLLTGTNKTMITVSPYTGEILSSVKLSAPAYLPPIVANNQIYVLTDDGKLTAFR